MIKKIVVFFIMVAFLSVGWSKAVIDPDVQALIKTRSLKDKTATAANITTIIFLRSLQEQDQFAEDLQKMPAVKVKKLEGMPALFVSIPANQQALELIATHPSAAQISAYQGGHEELENSEQAILLRPSLIYPTITNWWDNGNTGQHGVLGLIDSGIATEHSSLQGKTILIRQEAGSGYADFKKGVRSAHGTGVACIYMGEGSDVFPNDNGIAYGASTIVAGLAGEGKGNFDDMGQTLSTLDWMLNRSGRKPTVINYSFGNGPIACQTCTDWSGLARVVDYVINQYKILWVKSAGNEGYIQPAAKAPFNSTLSTPADNYNGLTIANMNPAVLDNGHWVLSPDRLKHVIRYTSSRGPTLKGRKKPDLSAPGNDTRTCAPDPDSYSFNYTSSMDYHDGYRLMGGTSSAAPHVGAAALLLQEAGVVLPIAQKALLINAADAWVDNGKPGPNDPKYPNENDHYPVQGSTWNRTYGWGYLNMQQAYEQRHNIVTDQLTLAQPQKTYEVDLPVGAKITLVHERRVGFSDNYEPWQLSHLSLEIINAKTQQLIAKDLSAVDTVHQVANCKRNQGSRDCSVSTKLIHAMVTVTLLSNKIDGAHEEPFALVMSVPF